MLWFGNRCRDFATHSLARLNSSQEAAVVCFSWINWVWKRHRWAAPRQCLACSDEKQIPFVLASSSIPPLVLWSKIPMNICQFVLQQTHNNETMERTFGNPFECVLCWIWNLREEPQHCDNQSREGGNNPTVNGLKIVFCCPKTSCVKQTTFALFFSAPEILSQTYSWKLLCKVKKNYWVSFAFIWKFGQKQKQGNSLFSIFDLTNFFKEPSFRIKS